MSIFKQGVMFLFLFYLVWYTTFPSMILLSIVVGSLLLSINYKKIEINFDIVVFGFYMMGFYLLLFLYEITLFDTSDSLTYQNELMKTIYYVIIIATLSIGFSANKAKFFYFTDKLLAFFVYFWIFQTALYYLTGFYLDPITMIGGKEQKYAAYIFAGMGADLIRATSFFNEPGSYATFTYVLLAISYYFHQRLTRLHRITILTYFLTLSLFAIIIGVLFLIIHFVFNLNIKKTGAFIRIILITALVTIPLYYFVDLYLLYRFEISTSTTGGMNEREFLFNFWVNADIYDKLIGFGRHHVLSQEYFIDDATLLFKIIFESGALGLLFLITIVYFLGNLKAIMLFLVLLITKMSYIYFAFILLPFGMILAQHLTYEKRNA